LKEIFLNSNLRTHNFIEGWSSNRKTSPRHGENPGAIPGRSTIITRSWRKSNVPARHAGVVGAIPTGLTNLPL
jgi:hypothetical protein